MNIESDIYLENKPVGYSYRVAENIWVGEYPVHEWDEGVRRSQLRLLLDLFVYSLSWRSRQDRDNSCLLLYIPLKMITI